MLVQMSHSLYSCGKGMWDSEAGDGSMEYNQAVGGISATKMTLLRMMTKK
jgi:hypothetical protein